MTDEEKVALAKDTFQVMKETLEEREWKYEEEEENMKLWCGVKGDDFPMDFYMHVNPEHMRAVLQSKLPSVVPEDKRVEMAVAVTVVNCRLATGCFELNMADGGLFFRMSNSYNDSPVNKELIYHMLNLSAMMVDEFNDKFFMLSKDMISLDKFIEDQREGN